MNDNELNLNPKCPGCEELNTFNKSGYKMHCEACLEHLEWLAALNEDIKRSQDFDHSMDH
jgi:hypothetical protein